MKKYIKYSGVAFIGIAVFTVLNLPNMIYPIIDDGVMDTTQYNLEVTINVIWYVNTFLNKNYKV
ncbi:hypothetical protein BKP56_13150 [Marinilactibacillus sp. 15R]|nr:hypothetical protein BKP56_13150 [Marinilactibacillus sp. 15R]